jgi:hypothetical protein
LAGFPVDQFLELVDPFKRDMWIIVSDEIMKQKLEMDKNLAVLIVNQLAKSIKFK